MTARPFVLPAPTDVAGFLSQYVGMQIVAADPHPAIEGVVLTLRPIASRARRYVSIVRSETSDEMVCSDVREGSQILRQVEARKRDVAEGRGAS